ncbi:hypothetical protein D3C83_87660 [compost metagenome]
MTSRHCDSVMQIRLRRVSEPVARSVRQIFFSFCSAAASASAVVSADGAAAACSTGTGASAGGAAIAPVAATSRMAVRTVTFI